MRDEMPHKAKFINATPSESPAWFSLSTGLSFNSQVALWYYYFMFSSSEYPIEKLRRRFIGFLLGQDDLITAENNRRHESRGVVVREILDFGIPLYRKKHKLPAAYPSNGLEN